MRGKKAIINTFMSLAEEMAAIICGFILPRLILTAYGSQYNGLITSITQFLSCAVLLRAGIGGATRAALYKPLVENDNNKISGIIKATDIFMRKIGIILGITIISFATIYPLFLKNEFSWFFTFSLFVIIGISTFAESFMGITYLILLQADQKIYIVSLLKIIFYILNTVIASVLIITGFSIHTVKLGSSLVYLLYPIIQYIYVKRHYDLDLNVEPDNSSIKQRWDAFWHQVSTFVMVNASVIILTVLTNMLEVSVYSVYNLVFNGLKKAVSSFSNGLEAAFGNMIAKKEKELLLENVSVIEWVMHSLATFLYTCAGLLILSFVNIYTKGVTDTNYHRPLFAIIMILSQFMYTIRLPYQLVVQAAGQYKQTKSGAIAEPMINIVISVICAFRFGIIGVAFGNLIATAFRTFQYSIYACKKILIIKSTRVVVRTLISALESIIIILIVYFIKFDEPQNYLSWFLKATIIAIISGVIIMIGNLIFYKKELLRFINKVKNIIIKN